MEKVNRVYNITDAELLQFGELLVIVLPDDLAKFTEFDSSISAEYPSLLQQAIKNAKAIPADDKVKQQLASLTKKLVDAEAACYEAFTTIAFFVKKAYKNNEAMYKKFGLDKAQKEMKNHEKFQLFIEELCTTAEEHRADLMQAGCNENVFASLPLLYTGLTEKGKAQKKFKKERLLMTQGRIEAMNALHGLLKPLEDISKSIFSKDPVQQAKYRLPQPAPKKPKMEKDAGPEIQSEEDELL